MIKIVVIILGILTIAAVAFYAYYGGFAAPQISISAPGGETLIYEKIEGDYRQSGAIMDRIYYSLLNEDQIETYKGFGIYYDNPQKVGVNELRSEAGCILEEKDLERLPELQKKYLVRTFPATKYLVTEFPYKNNLSALFSLIKVYPALNKFALENGFSEDSAVMEIYDIPNQKIIYRKAIVEKNE